MLDALRSMFALRWTNAPYYAPLPDNVERIFIRATNSSSSSSFSASFSHSSSDTMAEKGLELLISSPSATDQDRLSRRPPPILFLHGGFGSAPMYSPLMSYLARSSNSGTKDSSSDSDIATSPARYNRATYALSLRGHGASYSLSYLKMVYLTTLHDLATDLARAVAHITHLENGTPPVIVAHSSGGGLVQYALTNGMFGDHAKLPGLVLMGAIPSFGNIGVYANWARHDPWFGLRMLLHGQHVASPLSSDGLVYRAFFGRRYEITDRHDGDSHLSVSSSSPRTASSDLEEEKETLVSGREKGHMIRTFRSLMTPYESLLWPLQMMRGWLAWFRGRGGAWLSILDILNNIDFAPFNTNTSTNDNTNTGIKPDDLSQSPYHPSSSKSEIDMKTTPPLNKICIILGSEDKLIDLPNQIRVATNYRTAIRSQNLIPVLNLGVDDKSRNNTSDRNSDHDSTIRGSNERVTVSSADGVRFILVEGAGHHLHNDLGWEDVAEEIRRFALQV